MMLPPMPPMGGMPGMGGPPGAPAPMGGGPPGFKAPGRKVAGFGKSPGMMAKRPPMRKPKAKAKPAAKKTTPSMPPKKGGLEIVIAAGKPPAKGAPKKGR